MEVRQTRTAEIKLIKTDLPEVNIRYTGRSSSMRAADSDSVWQILREYRVGDITTSTYASMGSFTCRWDERTTYFTAATPDASYPLEGTVGCCTTTSIVTVGTQYPQAVGKLVAESGAILKVLEGASYYVRPGYTMNQKTTIKQDSTLEVRV